MSFKKNIPNFITVLRILGTVSIIFLNIGSIPFFIVYTLTGATDVLDGLIARLTRSSSNFGAKLDSVADLLFYTVSLIKLLPKLLELLPGYIWVIVAVILVLRIAAYIVSGIRFHCFASNHTILNKATGVFVFAVPYMLLTPVAVIYCFCVCAIGLISTLYDLYNLIIPKGQKD